MTSGSCVLVSGVTHQVYGRVQTNGQASLWLFTHFNDFGDILSAYWSTSDTPRSSLLPSEELPGCTVLVRCVSLEELGLWLF